MKLRGKLVVEGFQFFVGSVHVKAVGVGEVGHPGGVVLRVQCLGFLLVQLLQGRLIGHHQVVDADIVGQVAKGVVKGQGGVRQALGDGERLVAQLKVVLQLRPLAVAGHLSFR